MTVVPPEAITHSAVANRVVILGRVRSAVGLAGWVKVESYTDPPDNLLQYPVWQVAGSSGDWHPKKWAQHRWSGNELQVRFDQVTERNGAEQLRNLDIGVLRSELPPPAPGEYYWDDLLGLTACNRDGVLGQVEYFVNSAAHPYMVLRGVDEAGKACQHFVPLVKGRVQNVDFERRTVQLDWTLDWN